MKAAVVYASKYGFTKGIAEFIADKLRQHGVQAEALTADKAANPADYDAFVIGSAVFFGKWMKEAHEFVTRNQTMLAQKHVWLFSSGPTGTATTDKHGKDLRETSIPMDIAEFKQIINPRDHRLLRRIQDKPARTGHQVTGKEREYPRSNAGRRLPQLERN